MKKEFKRLNLDDYKSKIDEILVIIEMNQFIYSKWNKEKSTSIDQTKNKSDQKQIKLINDSSKEKPNSFDIKNLINKSMEFRINWICWTFLMLKRKRK